MSKKLQNFAAKVPIAAAANFDFVSPLLNELQLLFPGMAALNNE